MSGDRHLWVMGFWTRSTHLSFNKRKRKPIHIDRMHKWRPKKYSFVYVLIRLTSLVGMYKIQKKCCLRARLASLISTLSQEPMRRSLPMHCIIESTFARIVLFLELTLHQGTHIYIILHNLHTFFCLFLFICHSK